ncbi:YVTN repeat-like/Quino protein amine dehydrogenase [Eremomyces bilateralis CBS 781.70]|uniref:YVTN repeat-like/Quino protein amine dehydrogenase n=1 Tax=Eremomyces bilateralis CBS 781.70 TaxID=1392243 RepID=A0A6G1GDG8_9PEZI|nr:YVTN repeat-like/Quino protein amine dehydrogenase [Eremomyces bilateralis CBS 781.70]KAF1816083.1 YVTN repeat-like/Quino protein amine dehydrogenase [Eremomyces bilateralis CBS 781.70]
MMNTRHPINQALGPVVNNVLFNDTWEVFTAALEDGYRMYETKTCENLADVEFDGGLGHVRLLRRTQYIILVGGGKNPQFPPNRIQVINNITGKIFLFMEFGATVLGVRLSGEYLVVIFEGGMTLYTFKDRPELLQSLDTASNPLGLCCLGKRLYAFPASTSGQIRLVDLKTRNVSIIPAHNSALQAISLSNDEEILVSASKTGTLIRVWSTSNCSKLAELRRGVEYSTIFSLAISPSNKYLAVTSDKSTLHIFDLEEVLSPGANTEAVRQRSGSATKRPSETQQKYGLLAQIPGMPRLFSDHYSFATAHFESVDEEEEFVGAMKNKREWCGPGIKPVKGLIGWTTDEDLHVVGAGFDARWEKYAIRVGAENKRTCVRLGWRRYMDL